MTRRILPKSILINYLNSIHQDYVTPLTMHMAFTLYGQDLEIEEENNEQETDTKRIEE